MSLLASTRAAHLGIPEAAARRLAVRYPDPLTELATSAQVLDAVAVARVTVAVATMGVAVEATQAAVMADAVNVENPIRQNRLKRIGAIRKGARFSARDKVGMVSICCGLGGGKLE
jgi:hypothetical protein